MKTITQQFNSLKRKLGSRYGGFRFIDYSAEAYAFVKGSHRIKEVLANIDKQGQPDAFQVFINMNNEVAIREMRRLPFYHLI